MGKSLAEGFGSVGLAVEGGDEVAALLAREVPGWFGLVGTVLADKGAVCGCAVEVAERGALVAALKRGGVRP